MWPIEDDIQLVELRDQRVSWDETAAKMGRPKRRCQLRYSYISPKWSKEDDEQLVELREQGLSYDEIGGTMGRPKKRCELRYTHLGGKWSKEEDEQLRKLRAQGKTWLDIDTEMNRTASQSRYSKLTEKPDRASVVSSSTKSVRPRSPRSLLHGAEPEQPTVVNGRKTQNLGVQAREKWSPEDDAKLFELRNRKTPFEQIGKRLGRTTNACRKRLGLIGKAKKQRLRHRQVMEIQNLVEVDTERT